MTPLDLQSRCAVLDGFAEAVVPLGLDPYALLRQVDLPRASLAEGNLLVPTRKVLALLEAAAAKAGIEDLGLRMAELRQFSTLGPAGLIMREQPTVRAAINVLSENLWTHVAGLSLVVEEAPGIAMLMPVFAPALGASNRQAVEMAAATVCRALRRFLPRGWHPRMICFSHPAPADRTRHVRLFGKPPVFDHDRNAVVVDAADLATAIPEADPTAAGGLSRYLQFVAGSRHASCADRTREVITILLPRGECDSATVAAHFGYSRRTLHRKLAAEQCAFAGLVRDVRIDQGRAYIAAGTHSLTEISQLLGFSCLSAFSRWKRSADLSAEGA